MQSPTSSSVDLRFNSWHALIAVLSCTLVFVLQASPTQAQSQGHAFHYLDVNHISAMINNSADHFLILADSAANSEGAYEAPKGSGIISHYGQNMWIGGHDTTGTLHLAAGLFRLLGSDYYAGAYRPSHVYDAGVGFTVPADPELNGMLAIDGGKQMLIHDNGFVVFDPATMTTITQTMPVTRTRLQGVLLSNGKTMLFGDNTYPQIQDVFLADAANGYSPQPALQLHNYHRYSAAVTLANGLTLLAGLTGSELYDPVSNTSAVVPSMPVPVNGAGHILLQDGRVFVAGGATVFSNYNGAKVDTQIFDPATNTWAAGPNMPNGRVFPLMLLQPNGRVLLIGGSLNFTEIFEFDPVANTIATVGNCHGQSQYCTGGFTANGDVLFIAAYTRESNTGPLYRFSRATGQVVNEGYSYLGNLAFTTNTGVGFVEFDNRQFRQYDPSSKFFTGMPYQHVWSISKVQIAQFLQDRANNTVNFAHYPDIQTWPAHGNVALGEDVHLAPFVDVNNDGLYRPLTQGDYPCVPGDQALWWVFHDDGPHDESGGEKIGIQVEATAFAIDCDVSPCPDSAIGYTTFYHYEISHKGTQTLQDMRMGLWNDFDLGFAFDDYFGCDTTRDLAFVYNGDNMDQDNYGLNPPAFGSVLLGSNTMDTYIRSQQDFTQAGYPVNAREFYNNMDGRFRDSTRIALNGLSGYDSLSTGPFTNYMYPGDAGFCGPVAQGWSELSAGNPPAEHSCIQSTPKQAFGPGDQLNLDFALVWARDTTANHLGAVCALQEAVDAVTAYWPTISNCFNQAVSRHEPLPTGFDFSFYPNPAKLNVTLKFSQPVSDAVVSLRDMAGRELMQQLISTGASSMELSLEAIPAGIFLLQVQGPMGSSTRKLVVQD